MEQKLEPKPIHSDREPNINYDNKRLQFIKNYIKYSFTFLSESQLRITARSLKYYKQWSKVLSDEDTVNLPDYRKQFTPHLVYKLFSDYVNNKKRDIFISFPMIIETPQNELKIEVTVTNEYSELSLKYPITLTMDELSKEDTFQIALELKDIQIATLSTKIKKLTDRLNKLEKQL